MKYQSQLTQAELNQWTAALRSGTYHQGESMLCQTQGPPDEDAQVSLYCCLGVLGAVMGAPLDDLNGAETLDDIKHADWLGPYERPDVENAAWEQSLQSVLAVMNDGGRYAPEQRKHTFAEIADWIEANVLPRAEGHS